MLGYTFEVTNTKTGEIYLGKKYAVAFDSKYFGEQENEKLAIAIEKYGRPSFSVKMLMPYESVGALDEAFAEIQKQIKPAKKVEPVVEEKPVEEKPKASTKKRSKKAE